MLRWCVLFAVACDVGASHRAPPPPPPTPAPPAKPQVASVPDAWAVPPTVTPRHKHAVRTADLAKPDLGKIALPSHGVVLKTWGLGGEDTLILDSDAGTIRELEDVLGKPLADHRVVVAPAKITRTMAAAYAAWDEDQNGAMPDATDVREDLYILDGDEAFYLTGRPGGAGGARGRPAAGGARGRGGARAPGRGATR